MSNDLTQTRPYLLRAMHEWMTDNGQTPLLVVDAEKPDVAVPSEHVENGQIILNISWSATRNLEMGNDCLSFEARFGGTPHRVSVPISAVQGIYARESGQGMMFQDEPGAAGVSAADAATSAEEETAAEPGEAKKGKRPGLRIVK